MKSLTLEIIVPTYNRPDSIVAMFDSVLNQTLKPNKIAIVDAGSQSADYDKYRPLFQNHNIKFSLIRSIPGLTYQRNLGLKELENDIALFLDDDVVLDSNYVSSMMSMFENDNDMKIGGITGKITNMSVTISPLSLIFRKVFFMSRVKDGSLLSSGFPTAIDYKSQGISKVESLSGCNMAYRSIVFETDKFDENLSRYAYMEDIDFSYRISKRYDLIYIPEAQVAHNMAPQERLKDFERYRMLVHHHHYLFKKNVSSRFKYWMAHHISLIGIPLQALMLKRSLKGCKGALKAIAEIVANKKVFPL